jgi:ABC-type nitrate/sulfonate/bicarbonate transport system ATPase subunit
MTISSLDRKQVTKEDSTRSAGLSVDIDNIHMSFARAGKGSETRLKVLDGVTAHIPPAQFTCIVGPSGCGKSTLLRIMQALLKPDAGRVLLDGTPVTDPSLDVGFVFQQFNLLPWRTVRRNVEFGLENRGVRARERRERARKWIDRVKLNGFEDHYPAQLSGGMQQRVGLARALAVEPRLLLMDEPFGSLDSQTKMLLQAELLRLWEQDEKTVIFITHDIEEAIYLGDVVYVMGAAPSNFDQVIEVPFERPRTDALRAEPEFTHLRERIWESLKQSIEEIGPGD